MLSKSCLKYKASSATETFKELSFKLAPEVLAVAAVVTVIALH